MIRTGMEVVKLQSMVKRDGFIIPKVRYDRIADFIISTIASAQDETITLNDLIEKAKAELDIARHREISWYLLQVKQDLQARKIIAVKVEPGRLQLLRLTKKGKVTAG